MLAVGKCSIVVKVEGCSRGNNVGRRQGGVCPRQRVWAFKRAGWDAHNVVIGGQGNSIIVFHECYSYVPMSCHICGRSSRHLQVNQACNQDTQFIHLAARFSLLSVH